VSWVNSSEQWATEYLDLRDDRLAVFGALQRGETKKIVYSARAVTAGRFSLPPVEVEAMYNPRLWAREAGGIIEVKSPWKDFLL
jgi:uncharacterized protein YfaS (alpha-2-macroglobulin family)